MATARAPRGAESVSPSFGWNLHGAHLRIGSRSEEALRYAKAHTGASGDALEIPDVDVSLDWRWGGGNPGSSLIAGAQRVGKELWERDGTMSWSRVPGFEGLTLEAGRVGKAVRVRAACGYTPKDTFARVRYLRPGRRSRKTHRTLFKLMYYAVYYPIAWHFARTRGWGVLHASAVERDGRALILTGFGGVGKSTLSLSLLSDPSFRFISDNLLLHDEMRVYALPEPIRLDPSSHTAICAAGYAPIRSELPPDAHPKLSYRVEESRGADSARADLVLLLRFTPRSLIRPLGPVEALAHLSAARDLVREIEGLRAVSAFLSMAAASDQDRNAPPADLGTLCSGARAYLLGIGEGEPVATTLARIRELFG